MSISGVTSSTANYYVPSSSQQNAIKQNLDQLTQAIQSGNLTAAQQAYSTLTQSMPGSGTSSQNTPFAQGLSQIGSALQSGNISGAQKALSSMQTAAKPAHHHHHAGGAPSRDSSTDSSSSTTTTATNTMMPAFPKLFA